MGISKEDILSSIKRTSDQQLSLCSNEGFWWYTLEANESICAEMIFLMHFMGEIDEAVQSGLAQRILSCQRKDGTWALYYGGPPDLSTTIECYWALKVVAELALPDHVAQDFSPANIGRSKDLRYKSGKASFATAIANSLARARDFILSKGGITHARVFTKIHLAQFGLIPWSACPAMPLELMLMPTWAKVNIYEFSSWARACIVPLLVVMNKKPVRPFNIIPPAPPLEKGGDSKVPPFVKGGKGGFTLNELFVEPPNERSWQYKTDKAFLSWDRFFINLNKFLKLKEYIPNPFEGLALKKCDDWICEHIAKTEDIYPALAYGAMALSVFGHPNSHPMIRKALDALKGFRQAYYEDEELPPLPFPPPRGGRVREGVAHAIHQQCCISPVWDTPWQITALLEAGVPIDHPALLKSGKWLLSKQITKTYGDWKFKNPDAEPGGWSFEFENEYFPDVDDTIQVLHALNRLALPEAEKREPIERGLKWLLSMQNDDGGWGAFDKNQTLEIVNKIPFSDHGACLDPSSPDVTGRMLALLTDPFILSLSKDEIGSPFDKLRVSEVVSRALSYLKTIQEPFGAWTGRWGVNYIYGTWCVLGGLAALFQADIPSPLPARQRVSGGRGEGQGEGWLSRIQKAADWLISIQHEDGGWSESPETYKLRKYEPYPVIPPFPPLKKGDDRTVPPFAKGGEGEFGVPSQTAWALMGLIAAKSFMVSLSNHDKVNLPILRQAQDERILNTSISRGVEFLIKRLKDDGTWDEREFTGTGFPNHFYIRYHGYRHFFPLLALGKYYRSAGL